MNFHNHSLSIYSIKYNFYLNVHNRNGFMIWRPYNHFFILDMVGHLIGYCKFFMIVNWIIGTNKPLKSMYLNKMKVLS